MENGDSLFHLEYHAMEQFSTFLTAEHQQQHREQKFSNQRTIASRDSPAEYTLWAIKNVPLYL